MPEAPDGGPLGSAGPDPGDPPLGRVVDALQALWSHRPVGDSSGPDALVFAEAIWLAAIRAGSARPESEDRTAGGTGAEPSDEGTRGRAEEPGSELSKDSNRLPLYGARGGGADDTAAGAARQVSLPRDRALPRSRELTRALRPLRRPWARGRRLRLDIPSTVAGYARSGELVPKFSPAPERWFDATVVIDRSSTMAVWSDTGAEVLTLLSLAGIFRTLRTWDLDTEEGEPTLHGPFGQRVPDGGTRSSQPRRLMLVVSDCASGAWRSGRLWEKLHGWAKAMPTALVNPLPSKIWRSSGLDLPAVRVASPSHPGVRNTRLRYAVPPLMEQAFPGAATTPEQAWLPVPVLSLTPRSVAVWARTLMRTDPDGCEALLLPGPGVRQARPGRSAAETADAASLTEAFLLRASPAAARLAVLCSPHEEVNVALLQLIQRELVPEAAQADLAEFVVGGLVTTVDHGNGARASGGTVLRFRPGVRELLEPRLGELDLWRCYDALDRFMTAHTESLSGIPALVPSARGTAALPAGLVPFARASVRTLEALGIPVDEVPEAAPAVVAELEAVLPTAEAEGVVEVEAVSGAEPESDPEPTAPREELPTSFPAYAASRTRDHRPYFFLSYAHTPRYGAGGQDPDMWVERLYRDLSSHVMALTDLPAGTPAGYMDREIRSGEGWSERLGAMLATCRVFVPLFSPRYFASEMCGKEWFAFSQRVVQHNARSNQHNEGIVPALWVPTPPHQLPAPAERLQFNHRAFGERYFTDGLYGLIKLRSFADEYEHAVYELAKHIVRVGDRAGIRPGQSVDYRLTPSAFGPSEGPGPRPLRITVAAPTRRNLPGGRAPEYYGDRPVDWNPYHPESARPIAAIAEDLARSLNYQTSVGAFEARSVPDKYTQPTQPEILLVDRWALRNEEMRDRLSAFDGQPQPWVTVMVPWNRNDPESRGVEGELAHALETVMPVTLGQGRAVSRAAARGVPTMEAFGQIMPQVVEAAAQQYLRHAQVHPPTGPQGRERPRLLGPMGDSGGYTLPHIVTSDDTGVNNGTDDDRS